MFFFFKQKTAYDMRISDWSSDVCSSDLAAVAAGRATYRYNTTLGKKQDDAPRLKKITIWTARTQATEAQNGLREGRAIANGMNLTRLLGDQIGRESCRERVCK